jgi:hypothetical protein
MRDDSVSVLAAMHTQSDRSDALRALSPARRAREAAALAFAASSRRDSKLADRYLDLAFAAADEVWSARNETADAPALIQEVTEAATQVDSVAALTRARSMRDPAARALSMLAVARVVLGQDFSMTRKRN